MAWRDGALASQWLPVCRSAEIKYGIPTYLLARQCYEESRFNPKAMNSTGAIGIMQLLPQFFPDAGKDAVADITTGARYLQSLYKRFSDWQLALAGYDWGPAAVARWQKSGGSVDKLPMETQRYVTEIIADVPVEGVICRTQTPQPVGGPQPQPSQAPASDSPRLKSLWQSATSILSHPLAPNSRVPLPASASLSQAISSPTAGANKESSMSTPIPTAGQALVSMIESDLLSAGGTPLMTLIQSLIADKGNAPAEVAAILKFNGEAPGAGVTFFQEVQTQLLTIAATRLGAWIAAHPPGTPV